MSDYDYLDLGYWRTVGFLVWATDEVLGSLFGLLTECWVLCLGYWRSVGFFVWATDEVLGSLFGLLTECWVLCLGYWRSVGFFVWATDGVLGSLFGLLTECWVLGFFQSTAGPSIPVEFLHHSGLAFYLLIPWIWEEDL